MGWIQPEEPIGDPRLPALHTSVLGPGDRLELESIGCEIAVDELNLEIFGGGSDQG